MRAGRELTPGVKLSRVSSGPSGVTGASSAGGSSCTSSSSSRGTSPSMEMATRAMRARVPASSSTGVSSRRKGRAWVTTMPPWRRRATSAVMALRTPSR
ncbi:MAG: hypothetical protein M5U28_35670 [Sandaracinaceae bacterium]|nr:hypothetical protein [Sandaracinaceae bacterium]